MAKLPFEITMNVEPSDENELAEDWVIEFTFDDFENNITFIGATRAGSNIALDWLDFLKEVNRESDGDFVNDVHDRAMDHVEDNIDDAYGEEEEDENA